MVGSQFAHPQTIIGAATAGPRGDIPCQLCCIRHRDGQSVLLPAKIAKSTHWHMMCEFPNQNDPFAPEVNMRNRLILFASALVLAGLTLNAADEQKPEREQKGAKPEQSGAATPGDKKQSPEEEAIRQTAIDFIKAYNRADVDAAAAQFTSDAEYVDEHGNVHTGRKAIAENLRDFFAKHPGARLDIDIESIRFVSPGVAVEDGVSTILQADGSVRARSRYVAVHTKDGGKWLTAMVREHAPKGERRHREELRPLEWLIGNWIDEDQDSIVTFACAPVDDGNFLLREFSVTVAGQNVMSGSQRIGWDPVSGRLRAWTFDSEGGYFDGVWHRDGDDWVLTSSGVTADGEYASGTSIFTVINDHTITWQAVDLSLNGVRVGDSPEYTLVRHGPQPEPLEASSQKSK